MATYKKKTFTTLIAALLGAIGLHRFYLYGLRDKWAWVHAASIPISGIAIRLWFGEPLLFTGGSLIVSFLAGLIEALVIGLTPDDKWDQAYNAGKQVSHSGWPLALLLILITGGGAVVLIAVISRTLDLLFTGGAYG